MDDMRIQTTLDRYLKELCLATIRKCYQDSARKAQAESCGYEDYLLDLVENECIVRRNKRIERYLRQSRLPLEKSIETFDMKRLSRKIIQQVNTLLLGSFLDNRENVLAFGNPGSGKTHLLCAIAQELIRKERKLYFTTCSTLVQELLAAKRDLMLPRALGKLSKYDAILIDDLGYVQQNREEMEVLFTLLAHRYEQGSIMITSNLAFSQWEQIFKDPMVTAAAIDRLVHHSVILELNLPSYRIEAAKNNKHKSKGGDES